MSAPSTFADFAALPGVGVGYYVNVSLDNFATQFKNYSTVAMQFGPTLTIYDPRIISMGNVSRAFGASRGFASGTFSLELDNTDGGCDWLINRTTYASQALRAKFELYVVLYLPGDFATRSVKQLGTFMLMDPPVRTAERVTLSLADDSLGEVASLAPTPTIRDWMSITDANRPAVLALNNIDRNQKGLIPDFDYDAPTPLLFGPNLMPITRVANNCYMICAVAGSAGALPSGVQAIFLNGLLLAPLVTKAEGSPKNQATYTVRRTPDIVKDGRTFHLLWVDVDLTASFATTDAEFFGMTALLESMRIDTRGGAALRDWSIHDGLTVQVSGWLLSHPVNDVTNSEPVNAVKIAQDLLTYYARAPSPSIITASFDAVRAARPGLAGSGMIEVGVNISETSAGSQFREMVDGALVKALRSICQLGEFDVFCDWSGNIQASHLASDYAAQTASITTLSEVDLAPEVAEKIAGAGERNAPYNRVYFTNKAGRFGPLQDKAAITAWGKVVSIDVDASWLAVEYNWRGGNLYYLPNAELGGGSGSGGRRPGIKTTTYNSNGGSIVRPTITCRTFVNGLTLELGDYVAFTWSRGAIGGPYSNSTMRVEGISFDPMSCTVELTLLWVDDLRAANNLPYLLDDETLNVRVSGSGGRTATVNGGSMTVTISSGNLVSDGVVVGDNFVLSDATEAVNAFTRNQVFRITAVTSTTLTLHTALGGAGTFVISTWAIQQSALTYRPVVPYFGKTTDNAGLFSDGSPGNKLLEG